MAIKAYIEAHTSCILTGWIYDDESSIEPIFVEAFDGDTFYACKAVVDHRLELTTGAKNDGRRPFNIVLPDEVNGEVYVLLDHTGHRIDPNADDIAPLLLDWLDGDGICLRPNLVVHRLFKTLKSRCATREEFHKIVLDAQGSFEVDHLIRIIMASCLEQSPFEIEDLVQEIYLGVVNRRGSPTEIFDALGRINSGVPLHSVIERVIEISKEEIMHLLMRTVN